MSYFKQLLLDTHDELIVDLFAGGGGASLGIEMALGRQVDVAINHDRDAVEMHRVNHPQTEHHTSDVFEIDPRMVTKGRPVGLLWASPDCTYHSKARGGKPIRHKNRKRRALAWVVTRWAGQVRPRVIMLENVEEFAQWGPLVGPPDALRPCPKRRGRSFKNWVRSLERHGYVVEWRELRACDYGAPTIRKRLFLIARCDGQPIVWPEPTHSGIFADLVQAEWQVIGLKDAIEDCKDREEKRRLKAELVKKQALVTKLRAEKAVRPDLKKFLTAAECIDWSIPMLSIFATREEAKAWGKHHGQAAPVRPLAGNTNRRIARGVMRYVVNNPKPFLVTLAHGEQSPSGAKRWGAGVREITEPFTTVNCSNEAGIVSPIVAGVGGRAGQSPERSAGQPLGTVTSKGDAAVVAPIIAPVTHEGERRTPSAGEPLATITTAQRGEQAIVGVGLVPRYGERDGQEPRVRSVEDPAATVVNTDNGGSLVAASVTKFRTGATGSELSEPLSTVTSNSNETSHPGGATPLGIVAANLSTYYGAKSEVDARGGEVTDPLATQPTENRHALVASFLAQNNEGFYKGDGRPLDQPNPAVCASGSLQSLVGTSLVKLKGTGTDADPAEPLDTVNAGGLHHGIAAAHLVTNNNSGQPSYAADGPAHTVVADGAAHNVVATHIQRDFGQSVGHATDAPIGTITADRNGHAGLVASFLQTYYGQGTGQKPDGPMRTVPTVDRFGLVTVEIDGQTYVIADIAMRMLQPRELYNAQGFSRDYIIDVGADGKPLTKTAQVRMCGNSVCPPMAAALAKSNVPELVARKELRSA